MDEKGLYHVQTMRFESCDLLANSNAYEQIAGHPVIGNVLEENWKIYLQLHSHKEKPCVRLNED